MGDEGDVGEVVDVRDVEDVGEERDVEDVLLHLKSEVRGHTYLTSIVHFCNFYVF